MSTPNDDRKTDIQYFTMAVGGSTVENGGQQAVMVPAYAGELVPVARDRVRALRKHVVKCMRGARMLKDPRESAAPDIPEPPGFAGQVARAACRLCGGWCCQKGADHAYLDDRTLAKVRQERPDLDARAVLKLYEQAVAERSHGGSCIFHGENGCTLDRGLRSHVCNNYFCNNLGAFTRSEATPGSVVVIAAEGTTMRLSPILTPDG